MDFINSQHQSVPQIRKMLAQLQPKSAGLRAPGTFPSPGERWGRAEYHPRYPHAQWEMPTAPIFASRELHPHQPKPGDVARSLPPTMLWPTAVLKGDGKSGTFTMPLTAPLEARLTPHGGLEMHPDFCPPSKGPPGHFFVPPEKVPQYSLGMRMQAPPLCSLQQKCWEF